VCLAVSALAAKPEDKAIAVGAQAPAFSAPDQNGAVQSFDTLKGANGLVLLFHRSADW